MGAYPPRRCGLSYTCVKQLLVTFCRYVWIYPYFGVVFPDNYDPSNIWSRYNNEDTFAIKNALKGTITMGFSNGIGQKRKSFEQRFVKFAEKVTGFGHSYQEHSRYPQTYLVHDLVGENEKQNVKMISCITFN